MAPKDMPWFRFYSEARRDPKIRKAAQLSGVTFLEAFGFWAAVLTLASESPERGFLLVTLQERFTIEDVAFECNTDETIIQKLFDSFLKFGMVDQLEDGTYVISNWEKRQFESDKSTERVRKYRESKQEKKECNVPETPSETETETESDNKSTAQKPRGQASKKSPSELFQIAKVLASVTGLNFEKNKGRLFREAKCFQITDLSQIERDYSKGGLWYTCDWRGLKNQPPTPGQIRETWGNLKPPIPANGNGYHKPANSPPPDSSTYEQRRQARKEAAEREFREAQ